MRALLRLDWFGPLLRLEELLCPRLTSAKEENHPRGRICPFRDTLTDLPGYDAKTFLPCTRRIYGREIPDDFGLCSVRNARPLSHASYALHVLRVGSLLYASSRPPLAEQPLRVTNGSCHLRSIGDFHPQIFAPCRAHRTNVHQRFNPKCSLRLHRRINPEQEGLFLENLSVRFRSSRLGFLANLRVPASRDALFELPS